MKSYTLLCFFLSLAMILCPLCSVEKATQTLSGELFGENEKYGEDDFDSPVSSSYVKIMSAGSKNITETTLREYLIGAVAAEISPTFHEEAVKAQAVAANTMLEYSKTNESKKVEGADITDSSATHQGYFTQAMQKEKWGEKYEQYRDKVGKCVDEVIGLAVRYNGKPIAAAYHAISNGSTENASAVWGGSYPYLISVPSAGDKLSPSYSSALTVTADELKRIMEKQGVKAEGDPGKWIGEAERTPTGMVKSVSVCGRNFKGTEIRELFSLKSATFKIEYDKNCFTFTVSGYGHGVGMSQYGADYMARQGCSYREILSHYYPNTEISK